MDLSSDIMKRRTLLKGAGVALLLPRLESLGQVTDAESPRRLLTIVNHLSFYQPELIPETGGAFDQPPPLLANLSDHFKHLKIYSGLENPAVQMGFGHTPCVGILSGYFNKLWRRNRISIDQAVAGLVGKETRFRSLVFQAGENLNFSQIAWDKHGLPVHQIDSPARIFNLLFQVNENEKAQQQILAEDRSILDAVFRQAKSMEKKLNATDRAKIDEYLNSVREVERRIEHAGQQGELQGWRPTLEKPNIPRPPDGIPQDLPEHMKLMCDIVVLAFLTDSTRICTLKLNNDHSYLRFPHLGIEVGHHELSHRNNANYLKVNQFMFGQMAYIAGKLDAVKEGERTALDNTIMMYCSSMMSGSHNASQLPVVLLGGGGGKLKGGRILDYQGKSHRQMCSLFLSLMDKFGIQLDRFGDSATRLAEV